MPSPSYATNKASIMRYKEKNYERVLGMNREHSKNCMRRKRAYDAEVRRLLLILINFFEN